MLRSSSFFSFFFLVCFILDSLYSYIFKIMNHFFCNVKSSVNPSQCIFHFKLRNFLLWHSIWAISYIHRIKGSPSPPHSSSEFYTNTHSGLQRSLFLVGWVFLFVFCLKGSFFIRVLDSYTTLQLCDWGIVHCPQG